MICASGGDHRCWSHTYTQGMMFPSHSMLSKSSASCRQDQRCLQQFSQSFDSSHMPAGQQTRWRRQQHQLTSQTFIPGQVPMQPRQAPKSQMPRPPKSSQETPMQAPQSWRTRPPKPSQKKPTAGARGLINGRQGPFQDSLSQHERKPNDLVIIAAACPSAWQACP